jgi:circadian clock protein KaiC
MPTGIAGFDRMTGGGLPSGRTTLLAGGPGCGKTLFSLQVLGHGARSGRKGVFVGFEETTDDLAARLGRFSWAPTGTAARRIQFVDGRPLRDSVRGGDFDLLGLLARIGPAGRMPGGCIVFDGLDVVLGLLPDPMAARREMYRLHDWLSQRSVTGILSAHTEPDGGLPRRYDFLQSLADCVVILKHEVTDRVAVRSLRVLKHRVRPHVTGEVPLVITEGGFEVGSPDFAGLTYPVSSERVSTGVERLDAMLEGGYHRGSSVLISGSPGTSKTILSGSFAKAASARGERVLLVSFDESPHQIIRNLASVGVNLAPEVRAGRLLIQGLAPRARSADEHALAIQATAERHRAQVLIVDPISAFAYGGGRTLATRAALRLLHFTKSGGITLVMTSLLDQSDGLQETTLSEVSTIADTWLQVSYLAHAGERNRALTIIKSRGTGHSNQVREVLLGPGGLTLADPYIADGAVLMGTLRSQRESADRAQRRRRERQEAAKELEARRAIARTRARIEALREALAVQVRESKEKRVTRRGDLEERDRRHRDTARLRGGSATATPGNAAGGARR